VIEEQEIEELMNNVSKVFVKHAPPGKRAENEGEKLFIKGG